MTLHVNGLVLIRAQLEALARGERVKTVEIGQFTVQQHIDLNTLRKAEGFPALNDPKILFVGSHLFRSRITDDGYTIDDVVLQIASAFASTSTFIHHRNMTALRSNVARDDGYGNKVFDEAVFELTQKKPKAELFSVVPKGDKNKIRNKK